MDLYAFPKSIDSNFEKISTMGKMLQRNNSWKEEVINMENFIAVLLLQQPPQLLGTSSLIIQQSLTWK